MYKLLVTMLFELYFEWKLLVFGFYIVLIDEEVDWNWKENEPKRDVKK